MMEQITGRNRNIDIATSSITLKHSKWIVSRNRVTSTTLTMIFMEECLQWITRKTWCEQILIGWMVCGSSNQMYPTIFQVTIDGSVTCKHELFDYVVSTQGVHVQHTYICHWKSLTNSYSPLSLIMLAQRLILSMRVHISLPHILPLHMGTHKILLPLDIFFPFTISHFANMCNIHVRQIWSHVNYWGSKPHTCSLFTFNILEVRFRKE